MIPTDAERVGHLFAAFSALTDTKPRRRRPSAGPRATRQELYDAVEKACRFECSKTQTADGFTITARYDDYKPVPGGPISLSVTYGRALTVRATYRPDLGQPERPVRVSFAAGVAFLGALTDAIAGHRREAAEPDSCYCFAVPMPPCYWCERQAWCEECGVFVPEDEMDEHMDAEHPTNDQMEGN